MSLTCAAVNIQSGAINTPAHPPKDDHFIPAANQGYLFGRTSMPLTMKGVGPLRYSSNA